MKVDLACPFYIFDKRAFGIKLSSSLFLDSILVMTMFNFQLWWSHNKNSWYYLTYCTSQIFFTFSNVLLNKSNCFRTVELQSCFSVNLPFQIWYCIISNILYYWLIWTEWYDLQDHHIFCMYQDHLIHLSKNRYCYEQQDNRAIVASLKWVGRCPE